MKLKLKPGDLIKSQRALNVWKLRADTPEHMLVTGRLTDSIGIFGLNDVALVVEAGGIYVYVLINAQLGWVWNDPLRRIGDE